VRTKTINDLLRLVERSTREAIAIIEREEGAEEEPKAAQVAPTNGSVSGGWNQVDRLEGEAWTWPDGNVDTYSEIVVYEGTGAFAGMKLGIGYQDAAAKKGETNGFVFSSGGGSKRPLTVFFPADDFASSHELVSMIRGRDGGRKTFAPSDSLPAVYRGFNTDVLGRRVKGKWNVQAVVANKDDHITMLTHTALQARLRGLA
jgi:hypothetical protein